MQFNYLFNIKIQILHLQNKNSATNATQTIHKSNCEKCIDSTQSKKKYREGFPSR